MLKYLILLTSLIFVSPSNATIDKDKSIEVAWSGNLSDTAFIYPPELTLNYEVFKYGEGRLFDISFSGFLTTTIFSNSDWFNNVRTAAINIDITKESYALKMQLAGPFENTVRRIVVEKSFSLGKGREAAVQLGKFPRLASFYNNVNDALGSTNLATIPLGEYSRRLIENNTLNSIQGINFIYKQYTADNFLTLRVGAGDASIEENCKFQYEITFSTCNPGWNYSSAKGGFSIGANYEIGRNWEILGALNVYKFRTNLLDPNDPIAAYYYSQFAINEGNLGTIGFKYKGNGWYTQTEGTKTIFRVGQEGQLATEWTTSSNTYSLIGIDITDRLLAYAHYDRSWWDTKRVSTDSVIGMTYTLRDIKMSLEYHNGTASTYPTDIGSTGSDWKKQNSPLDKFNSFVFAFTYQF